ncbi:porin family protein [uncultured Tenacibaculum sp.]|uniref:porin family protein n=1 Tax=uncultured Tenacibaculum sp. TaxID=174713 RepID=UPI00262E4465|nr:porin family protein [uncultured Tenacibaculum sp.]
MKLIKLLTTVLLCFSILSVFSQKRFSLGIQAGPNYSNLRFENESVIEHDYEFGYFLGLSANYRLKKRLSIRTELNYDRKVASVSFPGVVIGNDVFPAGKIEDVYEFITLPVLLKYEFSDKNPFFINGGVFLGYFLRARESTNGRELSEDLSYFFANYDFGFSIGVGKTFSINDSNNLTVELRNHLGVVNIEADSEYTKTNSFSLILGWNFTL